jgi:transcriptional regulator with XRE-family HTH domain
VLPQPWNAILSGEYFQSRNSDRRQACRGPTRPRILGAGKRAQRRKGSRHERTQPGARHRPGAARNPQGPQPDPGRTGLPLSTLSKVETGQMSLSFEKLLRVADGLGVDLGQILAGSADGQGVMARRSITRAGAGRFLETPTYRYQYLCADLTVKQMTPIIITVKARSRLDFGDLSSHPGEEFILVLEGTLEFYSAHYETVVLERGDSIYFDSAMGHANASVGPADAVILDVCTGHARPMLARLSPGR